MMQYEHAPTVYVHPKMRKSFKRAVKRSKDTEEVALHIIREAKHKIKKETFSSGFTRGLALKQAFYQVRSEILAKRLQQEDFKKAKEPISIRNAVANAELCINGGCV